MSHCEGKNIIRLSIKAGVPLNSHLGRTPSPVFLGWFPCHSSLPESPTLTSTFNHHRYCCRSLVTIYGQLFAVVESPVGSQQAPPFVTEMFLTQKTHTEECGWKRPAGLRCWYYCSYKITDETRRVSGRPWWTGEWNLFAWLHDVESNNLIVIHHISDLFCFFK